MSRGRIINVRRNIIYGLAQVIISQVLPFIVRTVLIYRFGVDYLGLNSLFASILNVLSLMELGFGTAVVYSLYKPIAVGDNKSICAYLAYYRKVYRAIGLAVLLVGLSLMPFLRSLVRDPILPGELNLYLCYVIFLANSAISYLLYGYMTAIPIAFQRRDILSCISMGITLLRCAVQIVILLVCSNFYLYLIILPVTTVIQNVVTARIVKNVYPDIECCGEISLEQKHDLNKKVYGLLINKLTSVSRNSIDSLCISAFIGLTVTGMYSNYYFVVTALLSFSGVVCNSMMASVGNSIATENTEKNYADLRLFDFIYMAIIGWATVCMLCLYQPFISVWVGPQMMLDNPAAIGLCSYFYVLKAGDIRWVYHEGAGLWWECRYIMIGEAIANVVLNLLLCKIMGVTGVILATVISVFITNGILCPRLLFKDYFKNDKLYEYWQDHARYAMTMFLTAGLSWVLCEQILPLRLVTERAMINSLLCLGGRFLICSVLAPIVFWLIWHRSVQYLNALSYMKKIIKF